MSHDEQHPYFQAYSGKFSGILRWPQLDELWSAIKANSNDDWYIYAVGHTPPEEAASTEEISTFITEIDILLRKDHDEKFCGIVYADNRITPTFVKIFDPNNLGSVCGSSHSSPALPGWIMSKMKPIDLPEALPQPGNRQRWWSKIWKR